MTPVFISVFLKYFLSFSAQFFTILKKDNPTAEKMVALQFSKGSTEVETVVLNDATADADTTQQLQESAAAVTSVDGVTTEAGACEPSLWLPFSQWLLYHRTCKRDFLCSWPSLNSYLK